MKGTLILRINQTTESIHKVLDVFKRTFGEVYTHSDKKLNIQNELELPMLQSGSIIIQTKNTFNINYLSKNTKLVSSYDGTFDYDKTAVSKNFLEYKFIETQTSYDKKEIFSKNLKNHYLNNLHGNFSLNLNYLSSNSRPFVILANRCTQNDVEYTSKLKLYVVYANGLAFIYWGTDIENDLADIQQQIPFVKIQEVPLLQESLLVLHPLHIIWKFNKWKRVDKVGRSNITLPKVVNYLTRIMV